MSGEDNMRGEFEAYFKRTRRIEPRMLSDGSYDSPAQDCCWEFWKASRESLVVELPKEIEIQDGNAAQVFDIECAVNSTIAQCAEAIRAAGVKTK